MKKMLIYLMIGVYLFGNFSMAFAEPRFDNPRFQQKNRSGPSVHNPRFQQRAQSAPRADSLRFQQRAESAPRADSPRFQQRAESAPQVHSPKARQRPYTAPRVNEPHVGPQHRTAPQFNKPHVAQKYRPGPRVYQPPVWRGYRPFPRVIYPRLYPYGHRVVVLPHGFISLTISGLIYYYASGNFYRDYSGYYTVVTPPIGAVIPIPPPQYRIVTIDSEPYYLSGGVYYIWDDAHRGYRVVPPPQQIYESSEEVPDSIEGSLDLFIYPRAGQSEDQQGKDRYECHLWAVDQTGFDPSLEQSSTEMEREDYKRAITACLEGREYTVR